MATPVMPHPTRSSDMPETDSARRHWIAQAADSQGQYDVMHGSAIYAYDPRGRLRLLMGTERTFDAMAADIARLLRE